MILLPALAALYLVGRAMFAGDGALTLAAFGIAVILIGIGRRLTRAGPPYGLSASVPWPSGPWWRNDPALYCFVAVTLDRQARGRHRRQDSDHPVLRGDLDSIRSLLDLSDHPDRPCIEANAIAERHLSEVRQKIAQLRALQRALSRMTAECAGGRVSACKVIEALHDHSASH